MTLLWLQGALLLLGICSASVLGPMETLWDEQAEKGVSQEAAYPPYLMQFGRMLTSVTHALFERHESMMNDRLKRLEMLVDSTCRPPPPAHARAPGNDVEARLTKRLDGFGDQISSLLESLGDFGANIHFFMKKIEDSLTTLPTKMDLERVRERLRAAAREMISATAAESPTAPAKNIEKRLSTFVTRDDLAKHTRRLDYQLQGLRDQMGNASLKEVLNLTRRTFRSMSSLRPLYESLAKVASNCDLKEGQFDRLEEMMQEISEDVDENGSVLSGMGLALEDAEDMLVERLEALERLTEQLRKERTNSEAQEVSSTSTTTSAPTTQGSQDEPATHLSITTTE
ncbi:uncharacterized protein LOC122258896 isoform X2 [Penaeus japonicus]|uniref:uncharacterized protein LOC122258896 isoform X2 n=1 Tax=Penaeus japonicus TaxID=27405 RepID=UPI001C711373|nr:uncharacterized protein LOC122258896 isoform X2 [Penaeus japonicus]